MHLDQTIRFAAPCSAELILVSLEFEELVELTQGYSGADLTNLTTEAAHVLNVQQENLNVESA